MRAELRAGDLGGWVAGDGPPVLLLHGGPGMAYTYLDSLAEEIGAGYRVAAFQQRGLEPSSLDGPFDLGTAVADVAAVLDALGWERAWVIGHSWGGHLLLHCATAIPDRMLGGLAVDLLGGVGDGGEAAFEAELMRRTPPEAAERAKELDERGMQGDATPEELRESLELLWPAYFAAPDHTMPFLDARSSIPAYSGIWDAAKAALPALEASLGTIAMPFGVLAGGGSPMPVEDAAAATARAIPGAWLEIAEGAGHFPWFERPGCVRSALDRLVGVGEDARHDDVPGAAR
jgi:pimeloyl-ACP methyl ester carboxylesterase